MGGKGRNNGDNFRAGDSVGRSRFPGNSWRVHGPSHWPQMPPKTDAASNRILFVKNLAYSITGSDLYELFERYGAIRQIRIGTERETKGTAYVVFEDSTDAKTAYDKLNGFHLQDRYLVILFHQAGKQAAKADFAKREAEVEELKRKHSIEADD